MTRCLITGSEGFVGSHLADLLVAKGLSVCGMVYGNPENLHHIEQRMSLVRGDLRDGRQVQSIIDKTHPDLVFHLAAQSFVSVSWEDPEETLRTNVLGTFYLLEALRESGLNPPTLIVGSSSMYGPSAEEEIPLGEETAFKPTSMYAVSKAVDDLLGYFYWKVYGMRIIRVRPFNMTGPRKVGDACSDFARGIAEIELGVRSVLEVGNLETTRDFTDGRDAARALWILAERGVPGEAYNLCSGNAHKMSQVVEILFRLAGRSVTYKVDPARFRPVDDPIYLGDNSKLIALGWRPEIQFEQTLTDTLNYWRATLRQPRASVPSGG
jgi:GDP-4-dehydro-6-deoxy-D-mannose reductase